MTLKAIIFDVDGTIAETEELHRHAFNRAFAEAGHDWAWDQTRYRDLLKVTGGRERIRHFLESIGADLDDADVEALHRRKNTLYAEQVARGDAELRPGVARLIGDAKDAGIRLAIATTTSPSNLSALLARLLDGVRFDVVVTGEDVRAKKPDPEVYRRTLAELGLPPPDCVAIEDSRNGLDAARTCGVPTLVTPSFYTNHETFDGAAILCASLDGPPSVRLADLERLTRPVAQAS